MSPEDVFFADTAVHRLEDGSTARALRLRPLQGTWRIREGRRDYVTKADILPHLTTPPGAQTTLSMRAA
ncbi:hypothetical protein AB0H18_05330 [Streptomyces sp. NPDC020766]|uniref:hypothetical protein n=1 Tax=Streptomyces sp. NPDC020766 TaxID=3155011 RepID=UPI0033EF5CBA